MSESKEEKSGAASTERAVEESEETAGVGGSTAVPSVPSAARGPWGSVLAAARLNPDRLGQAPTTTASVLRPPQLQAGSNPFVRVPSRDLELNNTVRGTTLTSEERSIPSNSETLVPETTGPKFLPLHSSRESFSFAGGTVPEPTPEGRTRTSNFVFGQNLQDRVIKQSNSEEGHSNNKTEHTTTNGNSSSSELLFSTAARATSDTQHSKPKVGTSSSLGSSCVNIWGQVPENPPPPPKPPTGPILTGEEGETNVIQVNCRLFAFEGGQWKERCRGQLRLNDSDVGSRLVCRAAGSLRVLLNTKVWGDMTVERAGSKSLRVTATDSQLQVKVFLVMASPDEIGHLNNSLSIRVLQAKHREKLNNVESKGSDSTTVPPVSSTEVEHPSPDLTSSQDTNKENSSQGEDSHESPVSQAGNPVVIVSAEDEDMSQTTLLKRPLELEEHHEQSKKVCTNSISDEPEL